jgi:AmmeMemoRadiSam system protein B
MMSRSVSALLVVAATVVVACCIALWTRPAPSPESLPGFPSYFLQPTFVQDAFDAVDGVPARDDVGMVLVNHHLLGAVFIARTLSVVASSEPTTVVLISPDHFAGGSAPVTSALAQWPTPFGTLLPATDAIQTLSAVGAVHLQAAPFVREHGITNITMFIAKALPNARLVPIIVRDNATHEEMSALARAIVGLPGRVIIVGSFDFTHDATDAAARANDARSRDILRGGNPEDADDVVVDSKPGIRLLMTIASLRHLSFTVSDMSNSAQVLRQPERTDVTSYITGTWAP